MAENKLEGFEDFDNIMAEGQSAPQPGGAAGELDDLLGKEGGAAEGGESELDSFFEDLSTIDDLEVMQEEEKPSAAPPSPAAAAAAPPPPREEKAAPAPKPKPVKKPRAPGKPGRLKRLILLAALAGIFGGGGYYVYTTYIAGEGKIPWPTFSTESLFPKKPPAPIAVEPPKPAPPPKPVERKPVAPKHVGPTFGIQVATCFFDSCVTAYRAMLKANHYGSVELRERSGRTEVLEIYSQTGFSDRQTAQDLADKINKENRLEGNAFVLEEAKAFRISMGSFTDLSRANVVKDTLNQRYHGDVVFGQRLKALPYSLKAVITGKYPSRADAERALTELRKLDRGLDGAFIVQN